MILAAASLTPAEVARYQRFHEAEVAADTARPQGEEMIAVVLHRRDCLGNSVLAAEAAYGAPFDAHHMREYVVLRYVADLLDRVLSHRTAVAPILYPELAPKRRRA